MHRLGMLFILMLFFGTIAPASAQQYRSPSRNFHSLWWVFHRNYPFFRVRKVNWIKTYRKYNAKINRRTSRKRLYCLLSEMLDQLKDGHVSLHSYEFDKDDCRSYKVRKEPSLDWDELGSQIADYQLDNEEDYLDGSIRWGRLKKDKRVGYIQINELEDLDNCGALRKLQRSSSKDDSFSCDSLSNEEAAGLAMKYILRDMKGTTGLILDLRLNGGGEDDAALAMLQHFNNKRRLAFTKQELDFGRLKSPERYYIEPKAKPYSKPVMVLISKQTQSAAEVMALAARQVPTMTLIGSRTQGILSNLSWAFLPIGWWYTYSDETYYSPYGKVYEKVGIPPNVRIKYPRDLRKLYKALNSRKDKAIDKALLLLK